MPVPARAHPAHRRDAGPRAQRRRRRPDRRAGRLADGADHGPAAVSRVRADRVPRHGARGRPLRRRDRRRRGRRGPLRGRGRARADRHRLRAASARRGRRGRARPGGARAPCHRPGQRRRRVDGAGGRPGATPGRGRRDRPGHAPHQPGERRADRDARGHRALGGGHRHARALGVHPDAAPPESPARALPAHGRDGCARDRPGRGGRLRPQDRRRPRGHRRVPRRHRHAPSGEVDRGPHGVLPQRSPRARGRPRADPRGRPRRRAARRARPLPDRPRRLPRSAGPAAPDQHHARRALSAPRRGDPPPRGVDQQGAHGRVPRLRASRVELRPRGPRRPAGPPPGPGSRRTSGARTSCAPTSCRSRT